MPEQLMTTVTVIFALVTGTGAGVLSLLAWEVFRKSPFGRAVLALTITMIVMILYHLILLLFPSTPTAAKILKSAMFTGVMIFIWVMVWDQHRVQRKIIGRETNDE